MTQYPESSYLRGDLAEAHGEAYALALANMTGHLIRSEALKSPSRRKSARDAASGTRMALAYILRVDHDLSEDEALALIKRHEGMYREAYAKDRAEIDAAG